MADANETYYHHFDGLGSVVALSDVNNVLVERYAYDVFGRPTIRDANGAEISETAVGNPYLFTGRRYDAETALYYYRARYYDYYAGRFLEPDPLGYTDGLNVYSYVRNNPLNWTDPFGLCKDPFGLTPAIVDFYAAQAMSAFPAVTPKDFKEYANFVFMDPTTGKIHVMTKFVEGTESGVSWKAAYNLGKSQFWMVDNLIPIAFCHRHGAPKDMPINKEHGTGLARPNMFSDTDQLVQEYVEIVSGSDKTIYTYLENREGEMRRYHPDIDGPPQGHDVSGTYVGKKDDLLRLAR